MADQQQADQKQFAIARLYIKDLSFESPNSPSIFNQQDQWKPELKMDIGTNTTPLEDDFHEVVLSLTTTVKSNEVNAFVAEVKYAGIFKLGNFTDEEKKQMLGSYCPNVIYPYARQIISEMVSQGGFPQMLLAPVNFDALYAKHLEQQKQQSGDGEGSSGGGKSAKSSSKKDAKGGGADAQSSAGV